MLDLNSILLTAFVLSYSMVVAQDYVNVSESPIAAALSKTIVGIGGRRPIEWYCRISGYSNFNWNQALACR